MAAIFFLMHYILALTAFGGNMKQLELDNYLKKKNVYQKPITKKQLTRMIGTSHKLLSSLKKQFHPPPHRISNSFKYRT